MLSVIYSDILSRIYSGILSGSFQAFILAFSLACVRVQAWPTASGARDMAHNN